MSSPTNNVKIESSRICGVPIDFGLTYNSGDFLKWDQVNYKAVPFVPADSGNSAVAAFALGVAVDTQPITSLKQNLQLARMCVITRGLCEFLVGDNATYYPGDYVGIGNDPQTIIHTSGSSSLSIAVVAPENTQFVGVQGGQTVGITATAGVTKLLVWLKPGASNLLPF